MRVFFCKDSDSAHRVKVIRSDATEESRTLSSRSFVYHDFAHFALELEIPLPNAFWGSVAKGASLSGTDGFGPDIELAESIAGPAQILVKKDAPASSYAAVLGYTLPDPSNVATIANAIHKRVRQLKGQWRATNFGKCMEVEWPE